MSDLENAEYRLLRFEGQTSSLLTAIKMAIEAAEEERMKGPLYTEKLQLLTGLFDSLWDAHRSENKSRMDVQGYAALEAVDADDRSFKRRQQAAHSAVAAAVLSGVLVRSTHCERCPTVADNTIGHHHDYDKPLDVEWLCRPCHGKHHSEHGSAI